MKQSLIYRIAMVLILLFGAMSAASAANRFYLETGNIEPGETRTLAFILDNEETFYGFQTDITFPEGLNIVTLSNGKYDCALSDRFDSSYSLLVHPQSNGDIRFGTYSTTHTAISGNSGALMYVTVQAAADFAGGELTIHNSYFVTEKDRDVELEDCIVSIGNVHENRFYIEDFEIEAGEKKTISMLLDNETAFAAFQTDLYLPEGLSADNFVVGSRCAEHTIATKNYGDGRIRITCFSASNDNFEGKSGEVVSFSLTAASSFAAECEIDLKNNFFTTANATEFVLPNSSALVTLSKSTVGIDSADLDKLSVRTSGGRVVINGLTSGTIVRLLDFSGRVIACEVAADSSMSLYVNGEKFIILSIGEYSRKLIAN